MEAIRHWREVQRGGDGNPCGELGAQTEAGGFLPAPLPPGTQGCSACSEAPSQAVHQAHVPRAEEARDGESREERGPQGRREAWDTGRGHPAIGPVMHAAQTKKGSQCLPPHIHSPLPEAPRTILSDNANTPKKVQLGTPSLGGYSCVPQMIVHLWGRESRE